MFMELKKSQKLNLTKVHSLKINRLYLIEYLAKGVPEMPQTLQAIFNDIG